MNTIDVNTLVEKYKAYFEALNVRIYSQKPDEDLLMLRWWMHLNETGDIKRLILPEARRLPSFLNIFKHPTTLIYTFDSNGEMEQVFWATPVDSLSKHKAAYCGLWCCVDIRGKLRQYNFTSFIYPFAFEVYDALMGMTWQPDLLDIHQKIGYNIVGCIPNLYDEDHLYIVHLTREDFQNSRFVKVGNRKRRK